MLRVNFAQIFAREKRKEGEGEKISIPYPEAPNTGF